MTKQEYRDQLVILANDNNSEVPGVYQINLFDTLEQMTQELKSDTPPEWFDRVIPEIYNRMSQMFSVVGVHAEFGTVVTSEVFAYFPELCVLAVENNL